MKRISNQNVLADAPSADRHLPVDHATSFSGDVPLPSEAVRLLEPLARWLAREAARAIHARPDAEQECWA